MIEEIKTKLTAITQQLRDENTIHMTIADYERLEKIENYYSRKYQALKLARFKTLTPAQRRKESAADYLRILKLHAANIKPLQQPSLF